MTRPRDHQRSKLYRAEGVLEEQWVTIILDDGPPHEGGTVRIHRREWTTVPQVQAFVDRVVGSAWWKKRSSIRRIVVKDGRGSSWARASRSDWFGVPEVSIPKWARSRRVVLHELSHHLTPWEAEAHGAQFASNLIDLVRRFMSAEDADRLVESFRVAKVKHRV